MNYGDINDNPRVRIHKISFWGSTWFRHWIACWFFIIPAQPLQTRRSQIMHYSSCKVLWEDQHVYVVLNFQSCFCITQILDYFSKVMTTKEPENLKKKEHRKNIKKLGMSNKTWSNVIFYIVMYYQDASTL